MPKKKLRILICNDDGIHAPGLAVAEAIARSISDNIWVVAPETEQSGASHSLTLTSPLRLRHAGHQRFALSGTPTDCIMMAGIHIMKDALPDLVISGVNRGFNVADDVTYSGTVAAAMEGTVLGIPSVALSQAVGGRDDESAIFACAARHGPPLMRRLVEIGWPESIRTGARGSAAGEVPPAPSVSSALIAQPSAIATGTSGRRGAVTSSASTRPAASWPRDGATGFTWASIRAKASASGVRRAIAWGCWDGMGKSLIAGLTLTAVYRNTAPAKARE